MGNANSNKARDRNVTINLDEGQESSEVWTPSLGVAMSAASGSIAVTYRTSGSEVIELSGHGLKPHIAQQLVEFGKGLHNFSTRCEGEKVPLPVLTLFLDNGGDFGSGEAYIEIKMAQQLAMRNLTPQQKAEAVEEVVTEKVTKVHEAPATTNAALVSTEEIAVENHGPGERLCGALSNKPEQIIDTTVETAVDSNQNRVSLAKIVDLHTPKGDRINRLGKEIKLSTASVILKRPRSRDGRSNSFLSQKSQLISQSHNEVKKRTYSNKTLSELEVRNTRLEVLSNARDLKKHRPTCGTRNFHLGTVLDTISQSDESLSDFSDFETESKLSLSSDSGESKGKLADLPISTGSQSCHVEVVNGTVGDRIMC